MLLYKEEDSRQALYALVEVTDSQGLLRLMCQLIKIDVKAKCTMPAKSDMRIPSNWVST